MMKRVCILGGKGNMGRRYATVLRYLGIYPLPIDLDATLQERRHALGCCEGIVIATPTKQHYWDVLELAALRKPLLVEKPLATNMKHVGNAVELCRSLGTSLAMINQYMKLDDPSSEGPSFYDYWNHGRDGFAWDCISVVALARGSISLAEKSPLWRCQLNGKRLSVADMDTAYIEMIRAWASDPQPSYDYITSAHEKVIQFERNHGIKTHQSTDRNSGAVNKLETSEQGADADWLQDDDSTCH